MRVADVAVRGLDAGLIARWRALAASAAEPNPFYEPEMALAAARHLPGGERDRLLAVEDAGRLVAALPVRPLRAYRRVPVPALQAWGHTHAFLDVPLVAPDVAEAALGALVDALRQRDARWLVLPAMPADGLVHEALHAALAARGIRPVAILPYERPVIRRRAEATYLDERLSSRRRKELRKLRRRLGEGVGGDAETVDLAANGTGADGAVEELLRLEAGGWKGRAGTALLDDPGEAAFFREAVGELAGDGRAALWALRGERAVAAMACGVVAGDTLFHLKIAHDEAFARASPGTLLELDLIAAFHADARVAVLDSCTTGDPSPSSRLYPDRRPMHTLMVPLAPSGVAAARAVRGLVAAKGAAGKLRDRVRR